MGCLDLDAQPVFMPILCKKHRDFWRHLLIEDWVIGITHRPAIFYSSLARRKMLLVVKEIASRKTGNSHSTWVLVELFRWVVLKIHYHPELNEYIQTDISITCINIHPHLCQFHSRVPDWVGLWIYTFLKALQDSRPSKAWELLVSITNIVREEPKCETTQRQHCNSPVNFWPWEILQVVS